MLANGLERNFRRLRNAPKRLRPRFKGAFPNRATAISSLPANRQKGYNDKDVADISFEKMCRVAPWDYPVLFWLQSLGGKRLNVLDAGGHMGTKYIAFQDHLDLQKFNWTVLDLPEIIKAARARQSAGQLPKPISFLDDPKQTVKTDLLLASGLLQYLDISFRDFLKQLPSLPDHILLNKVAVREGANIVTLEQIGPNRVPYQIRSKEGFNTEIDEAGYKIVDCWLIPEISHRITTHPMLGKSTSIGFYLEKRR